MGHDWQDWSADDWLRVVPGHVACVNASMQGAPRGDTHLTQHISLCAGIEQWPEKVWLSPSVIGLRFGRIFLDVRDGAPWDLLPVPDGLHTLTNLTGLDELNHRGGLTPLDLPEDTPFWFAPGTPCKTCYSQVTLR